VKHGEANLALSTEMMKKKFFFVAKNPENASLASPPLFCCAFVQTNMSKKPQKLRITIEK